MTVAILVFTLVRMIGIGATSLAPARPSAMIFVWALLIGASAVSLDVVFGGPLSRAVKGVRRLAAAAMRAS
jgi:hypothetical protein